MAIGEKKIETALAKSEKGGWTHRTRLAGVIQRYVDEPVQDFVASSDSKYTRLRLLLGILEPRLKPALQALEAPWLIQAAGSQYLALQELGRLAEFDNQKALLSVVDLSNRGHASAEKVLEQVEIKSLFRLGLKENDPSAVHDLARWAEKGSSEAIRHLFGLGRSALSANKEEAALEALQSFARIYTETKQDGPFYLLVVQEGALFEPLKERAGRGELGEAWLDVLKSYAQFTHYGALELLALSAAMIPSARQRLLDLQKAIPKEKVPEVHEFNGAVEPAVFEEMQFRMRRQRIRRLAIERLQGLLEIDR